MHSFLLNSTAFNFVSLFVALLLFDEPDLELNSLESFALEYVATFSLENSMEFAPQTPTHIERSRREARFPAASEKYCRRQTPSVTDLGVDPYRRLQLTIPFQQGNQA